jgi:tape measure domain-containing protein
VAVVAGVKIDVDARGASQALRQFQSQTNASARAAEQLQGATGKVGREMQTAANGMRFFIDAAGRARKENGQFVTTAEAAAAGLEKQGKAARNAADALRGVGGAIASIGAGALVTGMVRGAASAEQLQLRLKLLSKEYGETERVQQFVAQSAKTFGQSQTEAASGVADVYARLRPLGTTLDQIQVVYNGFNAVALASGVSAEAASGAFLQLSQALGSGTLQGDEFRSIAEQVPGILRLVSAELGVSVGELKKLGSEGKITSDVLINALAKGFDENKNKIQELLELSPAQRFKEFRNATQELSNALGSELLPAITPIVQVATDILRLFGQLPGPVKTLAAAVLGLTAAFVALAPAINAVLALAGTGAWAALLAAGPWFALAAGIGAAAVALGSYRTEQQRVSQSVGAAARGGGAADLARGRNRMVELQQQISLAERQQTSQAGGAGGGGGRGGQAGRRSAAGTGLGALRAELAQLKQDVAAGEATAGAGGGGAAAAATLPRGAAAGGGRAGRTRAGGKSAADKAAAEAQRAAEQQAQQLKSAQDLLFTQNNQLALLRAQNEYQSAFIAFGNTRAEIERKYNELLAQSKSQQETQLLQQARAAEYKQSSLTLEQRILDLNRQATQPLDDILKRLKDQAAYEREYGELIKNGTNAELAKQIIEINRAYEASVEALQPALAAAQAAVTKAEAEGASATEIAKYRKELERIQELQGGLTKKRDEAVGVATAGQARTPSVMDNIGEKIKQLKAELDPFKVATDSIVGGATAIGDAFGQAFQDVATGAKSTQEALADAFKGIGQAFISMAAEIIAKQLTLILLQSIFNALSGGPSVPRGTPGAKAPNGKPYYGPAFAEGGFVTGPTQALIGEGGEPEYVIPQSKMASAMARYSRGARGEAVIPSSGGSDAAAGGEAAPSAPIDVRYTVERINSVDYVTADQFRTGMARAAQQGATRGEQATLRRLQQSSTTRRRIGI